MKKLYISIIALSLVMIIFLFGFFFNEKPKIEVSSNEIISGDDNTLRSKSSDLKTYNYLISNKNKKIHNLTDNQGSGKKFYFVGKLNKKYIGIYGDYKGINNYKINRLKIL